MRIPQRAPSILYVALYLSFSRTTADPELRRSTKIIRRIQVLYIIYSKDEEGKCNVILQVYMFLIVARSLTLPLLYSLAFKNVKRLSRTI